MKNSQSKKRLQIVLLVLVAILTLGIGYASITAVNLIINGNATGTVAQENFKVYFVPTADTPSLTGNVTLTGSATIDSEDNTIAHFNVSGLSKVGDYAIATYTIINNSEAIGAEITLNLTSSNTEYFKVTETVSDTQLQAGDTTTGTIKVEMIKTPIENEVSTNVIGTLTASPMEDTEASGGEPREVIKPTPYTYTFHFYDGTYINISEPIPQSERTYSNFSAAKAGFGHTGALAHIVEDGMVKESYVAFEKNNKVYYLRGATGDESESLQKPNYEKNILILKEAFGPDWQSACTDYTSYFECTEGDYTARAYMEGHALAKKNGTNKWTCYVSDSPSWGGTACYEW